MGFQFNHLIRNLSCQNWLHIILRRIVLEAAQIWRELAPHYFPTDCFGGSSDLEGTGSTLFSDRLFWRQLKFEGNWLHIIFRWIVLEIWSELAPHYFSAGSFGGNSDLAETGSTLFSGRLFWRQLKFGGNWLHIIFRWIVLEIWWELAPHYFPADCFGGSSDLAGTGSTLFFGGLFWRQLRIGKNWLHIIFQRIVLEAAHIWRELASHYFPADCFGGSSNLEGTGSTLFSNRLFLRKLKFGGNWLHIIFWRIVLEIWRELAPHYFLVDCFGGSSNLAGTSSTLFFNRLFWRQLRFGGNWLHIISQQIVLEAAQIWRELAPHYFPADCFGNVEGTGSTVLSSG